MYINALHGIYGLYLLDRSLIESPSLFFGLTSAIYPWRHGVKMSRPQFVLEDDDTEDQRLRSSELPRYSEDSIDELALDRSVFEKDERFRDEGKMEQGEEEEDGFLYGKVPVSDTIKVMVSTNRYSDRRPRLGHT